jgi:charged multivesicular body protein 4
MNLFGKKKAAAPKAQSNPVDTINMLKENYEVLEKREEHITKKMEVALKEAKEKMAKKDKNGALFCLKRKKMYEAEVQKLQGARITLDNQILALESAAVNIQTFKAIDQGAKAMREVRGNIDADAVDDVMDAVEDEKDIHAQISEAISRPGQDLFDDEDLLNELHELDALESELEMEVPAPMPQTVFNPSVLPSVPTGHISPTPSHAESEEQKALRELEASMLA